MIYLSNKKSPTGVNVGTYAPDMQGKQAPPTTVVNLNPIIGYIEPAGKWARWIAWFTEQGDLYVYPKRDAEGGVMGNHVAFANNRLEACLPEKQYVTLNGEDDLFVNGKSTDHIWAMEDKEGFIGIRFDCGDSGTIYLTRKQALDLRNQLNLFLGDAV